MRTTLLLSLLLLFSSLVLAQDKPTKIPGTKVSMTPPAGFVVSETIKGFEHESGAMIMIMELDGGNYYSNAKNVSRENFEAKGVEVLKFEEIEHMGYPATLSIIKGNPITANMNLVFGDSSFCVMVMSTYLPDDTAMQESLETALLTTNFDKETEVDPFEGAFFSLDESASEFKLVKASAGLFMYAPEGKGPDNGQMLLAIPMPGGSGMRPKALVNQMVSSLVAKGMTIKSEISKSSEPVNGYKSYQRVFKGFISENESYFLVQTVMSGDKAIVFQCIHRADTPFDRQNFTSLINTLQID